ncbi:hypothetical protein GO730_01110 [Spirosoma sp. HMF3257]|uniref:Beta-hexosaminidase bacterial type N-terminal domain-containing protein n=1 Tax=Spirosoma telluris TaxID=2183553 RepID=A0A327NE45_9BACT|nr:hypothetical protein [Spirosoma telluris]RAI73377.1 hypothetical protein HMF3257_01085 [Spirosoma telluris]
MKRRYIPYWLGFVVFFLTLSRAVQAQATGGKSQLTIAFDTTSKPIQFGVSQLEKALNKSSQGVRKVPISLDSKGRGILVSVQPAQSEVFIREEGYRISYQNNSLLITAVDAAGAMYGVLDVAEQIQMGKSWKTLTPKAVNPHFTVRALKVNLPWSSYRLGPAMDVHKDVCRDLAYWQRMLDQMAENRFNVLSLWNVHPFAYMVKPTNFPEANAFPPNEMADWKQFWTALFRMAKERGIEPYIVNWNIAVSPEFAKAYGVKERNDTSAVVKRYTREVVTQIINEYPDLAGIGITLADWMSNFSGTNASLPEMTPKDREDWIEETVVAGIKAANRPVKLLHRSVLSADPGEMRRVINNAHLPDTTLVEIKFNWSHGHSTPVLALTHDSHSGKRDDGYWNPMPSNYRIQWMIRNEDFFILRWGQPDFIRKHIAQNTAPYVNGYFVGSEGYIPAKDYSHVTSAHRTWAYAFEKQWLFYQLWGRLLYDPATPDAVFEASFASRYGLKSGKPMLEAFSAASQMPLRLASFYGSTWDYTLYSEGFLSPFSAGKGAQDTVSSFISINELIDHSTLDPTYLSIKEYVDQIVAKKKIPTGKMTPVALADLLDADSKTVLQRVQQLRSSASPTLACELADLEAWAYLSRYFADKLRAAVALQTYRLSQDKSQQQKAITYLNQCLDHWRKVSEITASHYHEVPYTEGYLSKENAFKDSQRFLWSNYQSQVERDIVLARE